MKRSFHRVRRPERGVVVARRRSGGGAEPERGTPPLEPFPRPHLECTTTVVIGVIRRLGGCEKYVKHQNRFNTPTWTIGFVIQCLLCERARRCLFCEKYAGNPTDPTALGRHCKEDKRPFQRHHREETT